MSLSGLLSPARAQLRGYLDIVQAALTSSGTEPLPIRRLQVPADRVLTEMERARQGKWIHLTREEFEAKVTRAREVGDALKKPPQLLESRYRAVLDGNGLTGSGQWVVLNPSPLAGVLALQPFTLALRSARLDGKDAVLGDLDGKNLGLLVEQTGKHILSLDWSARGEQGPAGLRFRLEVPPCALTSLELELPADHELVSFMDRVTCLVSGPKPASVPQRRLWRLECPEPSPLEMLIRPVSAPGQAPPVVLASLRSRQDLRPNLRPGQFGAEFDISLEVLHGALRDLVCQCDPALWPVSVRMRNQEIDGWDLRPGKTPESPSTLTIRLPGPIQGRAPTLRISCQATAVPGQLWRSPGLHVVGAVPRGETLALQIPPDFELHHWQSGDFELRRTSADADGGQILSLRSGLRDPGALHRPSALLTLQHAETKVRGLTWWQVRKEQTSLLAQFNYEVTRGQLFHLLIRVPAGWQVDRVDLNPPALLRNWTITPQNQGSSLLQVELESALRPSSSARLTVELRGSPAKQEPGDRFALSFPALIPENAGEWESALAIVIDPSLHAVAKASIPAIPPPSLRESGGGAVGDGAPDFPGVSAFPLAPWSAQAPDYYYVYRGHPVTGTLQLRPRPARLHAHCESDVTVGPGRATLRTSLRLEPAVGAADTIDLASSAPLPATWRWKSASAGNAVRGVEQLSLVEAAPRFLVLGCSSGLEVLNLLHGPGAPVSLWRLTLAQPLHEPITLEGTVDLNGHRPGSPQHQGRWEIPLMTVLTAERMAG
ncbi:MAG TPA: hypothetical protein VGY58_08440, partial [Gemmataceae bacterium]|nr:hypothetical protein [Gemmataceae bacterium]